MLCRSYLVHLLPAGQGLTGGGIKLLMVGCRTDALSIQ